MILLQITEAMEQLLSWGVLGVFCVIFLSVILFLWKAYDAKGKLDHEENVQRIIRLEKKAEDIEAERKAERKELYEIISSMKNVIQDNTEALNNNSEIFKEMIKEMSKK